VFSGTLKQHHTAQAVLFIDLLRQIAEHFATLKYYGSVVHLMTCLNSNHCD